MSSSSSPSFKKCKKEQGFSTLLSSLAVICFQFCELKDFISLFSTNSHWYSVAKNKIEAWKYIEFDSEYFHLFEDYALKLLQEKEENKYKQLYRQTSDFLILNPLFKNITKYKQRNFEVRLFNDLWLCRLFPNLKSITIENSICMGNSTSIDWKLFFYITNVALSLNLIKELNITMNCYITDIILEPFGNLEILKISCASSLREILGIKKEILTLYKLKKFTLETNSKKGQDIIPDSFVIDICKSLIDHLEYFESDFVISPFALKEVDRMMPNSFELHIPFPNISFNKEEDRIVWLQRLFNILVNNPERQKKWKLYTFVNNKITFELLMKYCYLNRQTLLIPRMNKEREEEKVWMNTVEEWKEITKCKNMECIEIDYGIHTPLLTTEHIRQLEPIYSQLVTFSISNFTVSSKDLEEIREIIRTRMTNIIQEPDQTNLMHFIIKN